MRKVAFLLLIGCVTLALSETGIAAETWKWKDASGVVHYSDKPVPGAERIDVVAPKPSSTAPASAAAEPRATAAGVESGRPANQQTLVPYTRCVITAPDNDETFNAVDSVTAGVLLDPALQSGHRIEVLLNGSVVQDWPQDAMAYTLRNLARGSYTMSVRVLDADGGAACSGPAIIFHVRQPTVTAPRPQPRGG